MAGGWEHRVAQSGLWQTNSTILALDGEVVVVDPAFFPSEIAQVAAAARQLGRVRAVVLTHGHWDHVAGWPDFPEAEVWASEALGRDLAGDTATARRNLEALRRFDGEWYVERAQPAAWPARVRGRADGERIEFGGGRLVALALPGHSADGLGLHLAEAGLLLCGDYCSPCEIPFVEDLPAYRGTVDRLLELVERAEEIVPGHGPRLDRGAARAILAADRDYLAALADCAARGDRRAALGLALPRAAGVPGMADRHRENCDHAGLAPEPRA